MRSCHAVGVALLCVPLISGCGGRELIPSPNLYVLSDENPYENVPEHFRNNEVDVLYVTDRRRLDGEDGKFAYDHGRSRSMAFGSATLRIGKHDTTWDQLVAASRTPKRRRCIRARRISRRSTYPCSTFEGWTPSAIR